jgi:hypothetical protein
MTEAEKEHLISKARDAYTTLRKKYRRYYQLGVFGHITYSAKLDRLETAFYEREQAIVDEFQRIDREKSGPWGIRFTLPKMAAPMPPGTYDVTVSDVKADGKTMTVYLEF